MQIRLSHALGGRTMDLAARPADRAIVVGRWAQADVQVPSANVAPRQCVLFVHENRWVIQEAGGAKGTFVNGSPLEGPAYLRNGDVVTLGRESQAPTLMIEPGGRVGEDVMVNAPAGAWAMEAPAAQEVNEAHAGEDASADANAAGSEYIPPAAEEWERSPSSVAPRPIVRVPRSSNSATTIGIAAACVALLGCLVAYKYEAIATFVGRRPAAGERKNENPPVVTILPAIVPKAQVVMPTTAAAPPRPAPPRATTVPRVEAPATAPVLASPPATEPSAAPSIFSMGHGAEKTSPKAEPQTRALVQSTWSQVEAADVAGDPAGALLIYDRYSREHPREFVAQVRRLSDDAMSRLWRERLESLAKRRNALGATLSNIAEGSDEKPKLEEELKDVEGKLANELGYTAETLPNIDDAAQMQRLNETRDPQTYAEWRGKVLNSLRTKGRLPWEEK